MHHKACSNLGNQDCEGLPIMFKLGDDPLAEKTGNLGDKKSTTNFWLPVSQQAGPWTRTLLSNHGRISDIAGSSNAKAFNCGRQNVWWMDKLEFNLTCPVQISVGMETTFKMPNKNPLDATWYQYGTDVHWTSRHKLTLEKFMCMKTCCSYLTPPIFFAYA